MSRRKRSRAWMHAVQLVTGARRENLERYKASSEWHLRSLVRCTVRACDAGGEYLISYTYTTGRAGRTTRAERLVCEIHARRFARRHGLACPPGISRRPKQAELELRPMEDHER